VRNFPLIIGHRGCAGEEPENTLRSFRKAIQVGVDGVECDVHLSRDGYPLVIHDPTLERTTNGKGKVADHTLEELRKLDAGKGEKIPLLDEVLDIVKGKAFLVIEVKDAKATEKVIQKVKEKNMDEEVFIASFHIQVVKLSPFKKIFLSAQDPEYSLNIAEELKADFLGLHYSLINLSVVKKAHGKGIKILAWTVNEEEDILNMLKIETDAIATDYPVRVLTFLKHQI